MHNLNGNRFCRCGRSFLSFFFLLSSLPPPFVIFVIRPVRPTGWSATTLRTHNYCNMYLRTYVYVLYFTHLCIPPKSKRKEKKKKRKHLNLAFAWRNLPNLASLSSRCLVPRYVNSIFANNERM